MYEPKRKIMFWWPAIYAVFWVMFAILAPEPYLFDQPFLGRCLAAIGAIGLVGVFMYPYLIWVRFVGTMGAILYPLHRALSIAADESSLPGLSRRLVAIGFSLIVVISLLILYPSLWWIGDVKRGRNGD